MRRRKPCLLSTSKFNKYVVNRKLQHTDHLFLCTACFTLLFTINKKCIMISQSNKFIAYATICMLKGIEDYFFRRFFNLTGGMVVYRVEKSKVFIKVISEKDRDLKLSRSSLEFLRIHIWLIPLRE